MTQLDLFADQAQAPVRQPFEELGPFMQYMVTEHPESDHAKRWAEGYRREAGKWVPPHQCSDCRHYTAKVIPLGKTGAWSGQSGDCARTGERVDSVGVCGEWEGKQ